jgi:hypothetical protein
MNKGEQEMAVVTYTVSDVGGVPALTPDETAVIFVNGDFLRFRRAVGLALDIKVTVVGSAGLPEIVVAISDSTNAKRVQLLPPTIDKDGTILIKFAEAGGGHGGFPPSPP